MCTRLHEPCGLFQFGVQSLPFEFGIKVRCPNSSGGMNRVRSAKSDRPLWVIICSLRPAIVCVQVKVIFFWSEPFFWFYDRLESFFNRFKWTPNFGENSAAAVNGSELAADNVKRSAAVEHSVSPVIACDSSRIILPSSRSPVSVSTSANQPPMSR